MTRVLWVPGTFRLTNGLLDDLRAAGHFEGRRRGKAKPGGRHDLYAQHQAGVRLAVRLCAGFPCPVFRCADLGFWIFGHAKADPDAWYLVGKAAADGLADAGVLGSDRFNVGITYGRVLQNCAEERDRARSMREWVPIGGGLPGDGLLVGLAIQLTEMGCG